MSTATLIPVSEYLSTSYRPDVEYLEGELLERNVGEWDHSEIQAIVSAYLFNRRREWGIQVLPEQRVQVKSTRFRVPDVCVVLRSHPREQILTHPPFLCIEILSKDDTMTSMQERIDDYLEFGVPYVWVLDPRTKRARIYTRGIMREAVGVLETENPAIQVPLSEVFSEQD